MRNTRADVIEAALRVLDDHGLEFCSMRRVAAALDVQPSALYHHVPNKQTLLALMADEIVRGVAASGAAEGEVAEGGEDPAAICRSLRGALLSIRDGADVVATASAFRLGASDVEAALAAQVGPDGARTLLLYTFGQAQATQTQLQAQAIGALPEAQGSETGGADPLPDLEMQLREGFDRGIAIILAGVADRRV